MFTNLPRRKCFWDREREIDRSATHPLGGERRNPHAPKVISATQNGVAWMLRDDYWHWQSHDPFKWYDEWEKTMEKAKYSFSQLFF